MTDIVTLLDDYPTLSPAERADVDARLAGQTEWTEALARAKHLAVLVDAATAAPDADDLARRLVASRLGLPGPDVPEEWAVEAAEIEARLDDLEAASENPIARYERLAGESIDPAGEVGQRDHSAPLRPPLRSQPRARWPRRSLIAAVSAAVVVAYGGLLMVSSARLPERAQVAALEDIDPVAPPTLRGTTPPPEAERLTAALGEIHEARQSTMGLFPRYDSTALDDADEDLAAVAAGADPESWVSQEARLARGRVLLYRGHDAEAARVLGSLVEQGSYRGATARRLLDYIRAQSS